MLFELCLIILMVSVAVFLVRVMRLLDVEAVRGVVLVIVVVTVLVVIVRVVLLGNRLAWAAIDLRRTQSNNTKFGFTFSGPPVDRWTNFFLPSLCKRYFGNTHQEASETNVRTSEGKKFFLHEKRLFRHSF